MASKRKTGPGHAKLKRKRRRRYNKWNHSLKVTVQRVVRALGPDWQKALNRVWSDALFPQLLSRPHTEVEPNEQPGDAEAGIYRYKIRTSDPDIAEALKEEKVDD